MHKIVIFLFAAVLLLAIAFTLFFASPKVQTRIANTLTKRINTFFETSIGIGTAKIDLTGRLRLGDVLIKDHKKDTLFYAAAIQLKLEELEEVLKGNYTFSSLEIEKPLLAVTTHRNDEQTNLAQFIQKLKRSEKRKKPLTAAVDDLFIQEASFFFKDENKTTTTDFTDFNAHFSLIDLNTGKLTAKIDQLQYRSSQWEDISEFEAALAVSSSTLHLTSLALVSANGALTGAIKINAPQLNQNAIIEKGIVDLQIEKASLSTKAFPTKGFSLPMETVQLNGKAEGPLSQLQLNLNASTDRGDNFTGRFILDYSSSKEFSVKGKEVFASFAQGSAKHYLNNISFTNSPLQLINPTGLDLKANFIYDHNKSLTSSLTLTLNETQLTSSLVLNKQENYWDFDQQIEFDELGKGNLFTAAPSLEKMTGFIDVNGRILGAKFNTIAFKSKLRSMVWDKVEINDITLSGKKNSQQFDLALQVNDERLMLKADVFQQLDQLQNNLLIKSDIERIDLSAFGWTPLDDNVRLATNLILQGSNNTLNEIRIKNTNIENKFYKSSFNDFSLFLSHNQGYEKITQQESDLFQFSLEGKFSYNNLPLIVEGAFREALLLPIQEKLPTKEQFIFELALNKKTLQALYPAIETPNNIDLKGKISTERGTSNFSFNLPYISYEGYDIEGLTLKTSANNLNNLNHFKADKVSGKNINISDLELVTKEKGEGLNGQFKGSFGQRSQNDFLVDFSYRQEANTAFFQLDQANVSLDGDRWQLDLNKQNTFRFDQRANAFMIEDLALFAKEQSIKIDGTYQSRTSFSLQLITEQLSLEKILPKGEKFNFRGDLSSSITLEQGEDQQSLQTDITIDELVVNGTSMGDFTLQVGGSSQLKTFQLVSELTHQGKKMLQGDGNIFISSKKPRLDIDLQLDYFDMSFLSALGKDKLTDVKGFLSGELNLWGPIGDLKLRGESSLSQWEMFVPSVNTRYQLSENTQIKFRDRLIDFNDARLMEKKSSTVARLNGYLSHINFNAWEMDLLLSSNRFLVYDRPEDEKTLFYGHGYLNGEARFSGPTKSLTLEVIGSTSRGTTLVIPWQEDKGLSDTSFIDFLPKGSKVEDQVTANISAVDEAFRGFEMIFDLDVNRNAEVEIVVDQSSGSTLSGKGAGNILIETNIDGKFNIWGDFIAYEGIYNFKNLGLIDKKFAVEQGGTIVWEGDPLEAQLNIEATYQVPGGANPALLVDNPNFNRKIPTNVGIQLVGNLIKPDDPVFDISFPNTTGIVVSEINYRLADQQRRQLQAISLLSQGIFISDVSVSLQGITNNLYEKASDVFSTLLGSNEGKLNVGLNYLQGEENPLFDLRTEDRIGLTLSTQLSDRILINGKIGVPIDGVEQSVIVGDVQIDFILNESGSLKAKVFNRENDFRYLGDEFGYTQGMGMSYQVDFNTFQELLQKITSRAIESKPYDVDQSITEAIEIVNKEN